MSDRGVERNDRVLKYIFRIPRYVTLPEHEASYRLTLSDDPEFMAVSEIEGDCENLAERIIENRFVLNGLNSELQEASDVIEVLSTLVTKLEGENGIETHSTEFSSSG
ncbi:unnamed protein product [Strongylus vulgaris]|uniref:Uncharacterized protein n=1 Tax=Strongylus vulgaris TaxID=40348 RepID=A0A3P7KE70_STRVU|nr:unnamed protein product [Strongylus vulgaris]